MKKAYQNSTHVPQSCFKIPHNFQVTWWRKTCQVRLNKLEGDNREVCVMSHLFYGWYHHRTPLTKHLHESFPFQTKVWLEYSRGVNAFIFFSLKLDIFVQCIFYDCFLVCCPKGKGNIIPSKVLAKCFRWGKPAWGYVGRWVVETGCLHLNPGPSALNCCKAWARSDSSLSSFSYSHMCKNGNDNNRDYTEIRMNGLCYSAWHRLWHITIVCQLLWSTVLISFPLQEFR